MIQITPRVSGTLVELPIVDNQFVKASDLLFQIDPRTFQSTLDHKQARLDRTIDEIAALVPLPPRSSEPKKRSPGISNR